MGTLADEERIFLLNATGLTEDATLNDLRHAYFLGVNSGSIAPPGGSIRVDSSVGTRVFISDGATEHLIRSDTGARDITNLLPAGVVKSTASNAASSAPMLRREGNTVYCDLYLDILVADISNILTLPVGFRPIQSLTRAGKLYTDTTVASQLPTTLSGHYLAKATGIRTTPNLAINSTAQYSGYWETNDPWPTALPGIPA